MNSNNNNNNNNNNNSSNISPASSSPPYNSSDKHSNKRKAQHSEHTRHHTTNSNNNNNNNYETNERDANQMNVDQIEEDFDFEKNLALFDKNKLYEEFGHPVLNNTTPQVEPPAAQLNAYDSLVKQLNANKSNDMSGYHKISVANLFNSTQRSMCAKYL